MNSDLVTLSVLLVARFCLVEDTLNTHALFKIL